MSTAAAPGAVRPAVRVVARRRPRPARVALHLFLSVTALVWLFPLLWALYTALRPIADTTTNGYYSVARSLSAVNFVNAWTQAQLPHFYLNTLIVAVPAVILTLLVSSMLAFAVTRFDWRFNLPLLMMFVAGNLLPAQVIIVPLYWLYLNTPVPPPLSDNGLLYDQYLGIILIHVVFQLGFSAFVLSNYMRTLPKEITESALVDGAGVFAIWWRIILPLCRPALAALGTLLFTFIYNDFFWALLLMKSGDKRPITSALNNLQGEFFTNYNLLGAGALLAALPTLIVFFALQRQLIGGLTLGSTKG
ncbi:MAG: carbohydrate ABC transporter permease [Candidatus Dormibacteraeota bacterium]|nr:carbohydrate ABC transporter permease [Candidatus Dormibacteraeota bacterium]